MNRLASAGIPVDAVLNGLNSGLIVLDADFNILLWNEWMERHSGVVAERALDANFVTLFHQQLTPGFLRILSNAINYGLPAVLSSALHRSPLPLFHLHANSAEVLPARLIQSVVITPMTAHGGQRACLVQVSDASHSVRREKVLVSHSETLKRQAVTDGLTGVSNRRFFDENFALALQRARRSQEPLSLFMMDIDYFKQYNDCYGHTAGDHALKRVAAVLKAQLRSTTDIFARYGGEEFVMQVYGIDAATAVEIGERLRESVLAMQMPHAQSQVSPFITISVGVCVLVPQPETDARALLDAADAALYRAKQMGRNSVVLAS